MVALRRWSAVAVVLLGACALGCGEAPSSVEPEVKAEELRALMARVAELEAAARRQGQALIDARAESEGRLGAVETTNRAQGREMEALAARIWAVEGLDLRVEGVERTVQSISVGIVDGQPAVVFTGVNVHVRAGSQQEALPNGKGNLIIGFNRPRLEAGENRRTGSHNLLVGDELNYTDQGAIVAGVRNSSSAPNASAIGGWGNSASAARAVVVGGSWNAAAGADASVFGGTRNAASEGNATVAGGLGGMASASSATVCGGRENVANAPLSTVVGGGGNHAIGVESAVTGGVGRTAFNVGGWSAGTQAEQHPEVPLGP